MCTARDVYLKCNAEDFLYDTLSEKSDGYKDCHIFGGVLDFDYVAYVFEDGSILMDKNNVPLHWFCNKNDCISYHKDGFNYLNWELDHEGDKS